MRVPDLDWPTDLFDDAAANLSPQTWRSSPLRSMNVDRPFWPAMLQMWNPEKTGITGHCRSA